MRYLILSDIHANWEGLQAVLAHAEGAYDAICCLGDVVGYGADPNAVSEWVRANCSHVIRGNHDKTCCGLEDASFFNPTARLAVDWTHDELSKENLEWLRGLPRGPLEVEGAFTIVHGSYLDEDEYLLDLRDAAQQFPHMAGKLVFFGHTHVQGAFLLRGDYPVDGARPDASGPNAIQVRAGDTVLVNPGSVGQPRDFMWESAYAVFDAEARTVTYQRVPYDVATAQEKIRKAGLPEALAERLSLGR